MNSIRQDQPLKFTCAICGTPIGVALMLPPLPGQGGCHCQQCNKDVCPKHFSQSRQKCSRCVKGSDSWCSTPLA